LPLAINPEGVTTYIGVILRTIVYNFVTIYGISYNQIWYQDGAFIPPFNVATRQLDNAFVLYNNFHTLTKRRKLSQF